MKTDLWFDPPWMNAAGFLGYSPDPNGLIHLADLGTFITNPISLERRTAARATCFTSYPGGFLLHTGYPNPGLKTVLRRYAESWRRSPIPVVAHLLGGRLEDVSRMVRELEGHSGVAGVEIGLPPEASPQEAAAVAAAAYGELPLIVRLPIENGGELAEKILAADVTIAAFSLAPPRGVLPNQGELQPGRLYGPSVLPLALAAVRRLARMGIPIIGSGGVYTIEQGRAMLAAGALAVQLDSVLWRGGNFFAAGEHSKP